MREGGVGGWGVGLWEGGGGGGGGVSGAPAQHWLLGLLYMFPSVALFPGFTCSFYEIVQTPGSQATLGMGARLPTLGMGARLPLGWEPGYPWDAYINLIQFLPIYSTEVFRKVEG